MQELVETPTSENRQVSPKQTNTGRTHFKPGICPNPGGRPKGLASLVRENTDNGKELVDKMIEILRGEMIIEETYYDSEGEPRTVSKEPNHKDRIAAAQWLADRGFGKAVETSVNLDVSTDSNALAAIVARQLLNLGAEIPEEPAPPQIEV